MELEIMKSKIKYIIITVFLSLFLSANAETRRHVPLNPKLLRQSVVKIFVKTQRYDYLQPWQLGVIRGGTGTGFVISGRRILTNAHVVSDAKFLQVQKDGYSRRHMAKVEFVAHDCDLAIISVATPDFFDSTPPLAFADAMPELNDDVAVIGYPMGGNRISVTRGVVSRIDYSTFSHSGRDQHLVMQVDAAINPGNSGGPIFYNNLVAGVAFQGITGADGLGYGISLPVIKHFLKDIADGTVNGYPELGIALLETRNNALRKDLRLDKSTTGVAVARIDPFGSATKSLKAKDVLTAIDGYDIENDGTIKLNGNAVNFQEIIERKQWGESVNFSLWRNGKMINTEVPLTNPYDPFNYRNIYDTKPYYYIYGGLVFSPLTREHLKTMSDSNVFNTQQLFYYSQFAKVDKLYRDVDEFVVLINILPHPVNTYSTHFENGIVTHINGTRIKNLNDIKKIIELRTQSYDVFTFANTDDTLILDARVADKANREILNAYGVSSPENLSIK